METVRTFFGFDADGSVLDVGASLVDLLVLVHTADTVPASGLGMNPLLVLFKNVFGRLLSVLFQSE